MEPQLFKFKGRQVRTVTVGEEPYFVGKDVAEILGYKKPENAIANHVDDEDKTTTLIQGNGSNYKSKAVIINESGLYSLILGSKLPQAKEFKHWVTSEVLPTIRKLGGKGIDSSYRQRLKSQLENELLIKAVKAKSLIKKALLIKLMQWLKN